MPPMVPMLPYRPRGDHNAVRSCRLCPALLARAGELHGFMGGHAKTLERVRASAERVVLATAMMSDFKLTHAFSIEDVTIVEWQRDRIVDHDGKLLETAPRPILHQVLF